MIPYEILDIGYQQKLEQVGPYRLVRPALSALGEPRLSQKEWDSADAQFERHQDGNGVWRKNGRSLPASWLLKGDLTMEVQLTDFGHIGIFPEHGTMFASQVMPSLPQDCSDLKVLHLFAHTGLLTLMLAQRGAQVTHVDSSKKSLTWANHNAELSQLGDAKIRWILDDARKFVAREVRRGAHYDGIILDPPSYGRGSKAEVWKIEEDLLPLLRDLAKLVQGPHSFVFLSNHTPGITGSVLAGLLLDTFGEDRGHVQSGEMLSPVKNTRKTLASGSYGLWKEAL
jgi:23S rRNA (cytosine1962-C5)-methyltransferase